MYGNTESHKVVKPARPVISSVGSVSYELSRWLIKLVNLLLDTISKSHIKNCSDMGNKMNNVKTDCHFRLVSFDVASFSTKVPVDDLNFCLKHPRKNPFQFPNTCSSTSLNYASKTVNFYLKMNITHRA